MSKLSDSLNLLLTLSNEQGFLALEDVLNVADDLSLNILEIDKLWDTIENRGIIIYDTIPSAPKKDAVLEGDIVSPKPKKEEELEDYSRTDYEAIFSEIVSLSENLAMLVDEVKRTPPPQYGETNILTTQVVNGDAQARERLISLYMRNALKIALSMTKQYDLDIEDAVSAGLGGLVKAVDKYDPNGFSAFLSYASMWIQQNIQRECNPNWVDFYFPSHYKNPLISVYKEYMHQLETGEWTGPFDELLLTAIASSTQLKLAQVKECVEWIVTHTNRLSLEDVVAKSHLEDFEDTETMTPSDVVSQSIFRKQLDEALATLSPREEQILRLRFGIDDGCRRTLEEVGEYYHLTRERVRQIEAKALRKLKSPTRSHGLIDYLDFPQKIKSSDKSKHKKM